MGTIENSDRSGGLVALLEGYLAAPHPPFPGAVAGISIDGRVVATATVGRSLAYASADGALLASDQQVAMRRDALFDIASLTKMFATIVLLRLVDAGRIDLDTPVGAVLAPYRFGDKAQITLRHLLTHTSGLPAIATLWRIDGDRTARLEALLDTELEAPPGSRFVYSCVGYMTAMVLAEQITGARFDALVAEHVTTPLGLVDTCYRPTDRRLPLGRLVPTEFDDGYRHVLVHGEVHDENAHSLDGVSANAGLFSTVDDLLRFAEAVRTNGQGGYPALLSPALSAQMVSDQLPGALDPGYRHGLGWRLGETGVAGTLAGRGSWSHSGFTGTSIAISPRDRMCVVLLTNRVHPHRDWSDAGGIRQAVAGHAAALAAAYQADLAPA
jgi:CubicO group peptidase (beta-lactamase class C family)